MVFLERRATIDLYHCWQQSKEWPVEPTREKRYKRRIAQLEAENATLKKEVAELKAQVAELKQTVHHLTEQIAKLSKNSSNSSKPER